MLWNILLEMNTTLTWDWEHSARSEHNTDLGLDAENNVNLKLPIHEEVRAKVY